MYFSWPIDELCYQSVLCFRHYNTIKQSELVNVDELLEKVIDNRNHQYVILLLLLFEQVDLPTS